MALSAIGLFLLGVGAFGRAAPDLAHRAVFAIGGGLRGQGFAAPAPLYAQPYLGKVLRDWEENRAVSRKSKLMAISMMALSYGFTCWHVRQWWILLPLAAALLGVSTYLMTRPEPPLMPTAK